MIYFSELGERGRDNSAKDLVSNIFSVANKRIRKRDKSKSGSDSIEADLDSETYNERNIDQEIAIRKHRESSITSETTIRTDSSSTMLSTVHESTTTAATSSSSSSSSVTTTSLSSSVSSSSSFTQNSRTMEVSETSTVSSSRVLIAATQQQQQQQTLIQQQTTIQQQQQQSRKNSLGSAASSGAHAEDSWTRDKEPVEVTRYRAYPTVTAPEKTHLQIENSKEVIRGDQGRTVERQKMVDHDELNHHPSATNLQYQVS